MNGDFLRKKIELSGFQLFEVANNLGITQQNLQSKLKTSDVKVSFLKDLASAINKNIYYFFENEEKTKCEENINKEKVNKKVNINVNKPNVEKILTNENGQVHTLQKEVQDLRERLQDSKDHINTLKERVAGLEQDKERAYQDRENALQELQELKHQYKLAAKEIEELKNVQDMGDTKTLVG